MSISKVSLTNFKKFKFIDVPLDSPVTVILGENSSGKSSILKSILGLKQTISGSNEYESWAAQGEYVDLGTYQDYVHKRDIKEPFSIEVSLEISKTFLQRMTKSSKLKIRLTYDYESATSQARFLSISAKFGDIGDHYWNLTRQKTRQTYKLVMSDGFIKDLSEFYLPRSNISTKDNNLIFQHVEKLQFKLSAPSKGREIYSQIMQQTISLLSNYLDKNLFYLGPLRSSPSRSYFRSSHSVAVGVKGEYTPNVLATLENRNRKVTHGTSTYRKSYESFQKWLKMVFPNHEAKTKTTEEVVKLKISNKNTTEYQSSEKSDTITDVGFGFSQVFPILVQASVMPENSILIIEQPELHLHPLAQTRLANVVAEAALQGKRFIIETHSEHFIRGLQLAVSENRIDSKNGIDRQSVKFFYVKSDPSILQPLELNEYGEFTTEWPSGFFDESYKIMQRLLRNKMKEF